MVSHLELNGSASQAVLPQSRGQLFGELQQPRPQNLRLLNVVRERRLMRDRLGLSVRHHAPIIEAWDKSQEVIAVLTETPLENLRRQPPHLSDGADAKPL